MICIGIKMVEIYGIRYHLYYNKNVCGDNMMNDEMVDKFIDYINDKIEDLDMSKSSLARSIGIDKNSIIKYLKKERTMPLHVSLRIADYLNMDISKICGIRTEQVLTEVELNLIRELRNIQEETDRIRLMLDYISIAKVFNSSK